MFTYNGRKIIKICFSIMATVDLTNRFKDLRMTWFIIKSSVNYRQTFSGIPSLLQILIENGYFEHILASIDFAVST